MSRSGKSVFRKEETELCKMMVLLQQVTKVKSGCYLSSKAPSLGVIKICHVVSLLQFVPSIRTVALTKLTTQYLDHDETVYKTDP